MAPILGDTTGGSGGRERALPRVRGPVTAADPPSPRPHINLRPLGRLVLRRGQGAGAGWTCEEREVPLCLPEAQVFLDRVEEETGILRAAGSAPTQGQGLGGNPVAGWLLANPVPGPQGAGAGEAPIRITGQRALELARAGALVPALVQTPAQAQALAGARGAPALANGEGGELVVAHTPVIGEEALAGAGGAPALATGGGRSLW